MPSLLDKPSDAKLEDLPGGSYTAIENSDGTWNILDVPVMGVVAEGERRNDEEIGARWMRASVRRADARLGEGYLAPLHILHHEFGVKTKRAGFFLPTRVGSVVYEGQPIDAVFADLVRIPPEMFATIERGEIPYRSVEVHDWEVTELNSLALLEDEVPFFRFAMLTIGKKIHFKDGSVDVFRTSGPSLLLATQGAEDGVDFFRVEVPMIDPKTGKPIKLADDDKDDKKKDDKKTPDFVKAILARLDALEAASGGKKDDKQVDDDDTPVEPDEGKDDGKFRATGKSNVELAKVSARLSAVEKREKKRNAKEELDKEVDEVVAKLQSERYEIDDETRDNFILFASKGKDALDAYVDTFRKHTNPDPAPSLEDLDHADGQDSDAVMAFSSKGADKLDLARKAAIEFKGLKSRGHLRGIDEARYLELNVT